MPPTPRSLAATPALYRTKQELVYRTLRDAILRCELAPDQRLVIDDIARRLNVSTIPVREALQMLQSEGLVTMVPHVGAAVSSLSRESVVDVFSVLEGLQVVAGRLAASEASAEDLNELSALVKEMDQAIEDGEYEHWADVNTGFHARIGAIPGLTLLRQSNEQALDRWDRVRRFFYNGVLSHRIANAQREHHELIAALSAHDAAGTAPSAGRGDSAGAASGLVPGHEQTAVAIHDELRMIGLPLGRNSLARRERRAVARAGVKERLHGTAAFRDNSGPHEMHAALTVHAHRRSIVGTPVDLPLVFAHPHRGAERAAAIATTPSVSARFIDRSLSLQSLRGRAPW